MSRKAGIPVVGFQQVGAVEAVDARDGTRKGVDDDVGLHALSAGTAFSPEEGGECYEERTDRTLRRLFTRNGLLTGFMLIGDTQRAGIYTSLIRDRVPLDTINFELLKKAATTAALPAEARRKRFGGAV